MLLRYADAALAGSSVSWAALAESLSTRCTAAGIRPARAGNFSLSRQRKVTKREALELGCLGAFEAEKGLEANRCALALGLSRPVLIAPLDGLTRGCTPCSRANAASLGRRGCFVFLPGAGVQPRLNRRKGPMCGAGDKSNARAQRFAPKRHLMPNAPMQRIAVQRLFFGDFLLAQSEESYPPSRGGFPRRCTES